MAKKGLGRGLDVLLGDTPKPKSASASSVTTDKLPIEYIIPNPEQPRKRFADDAIAELAASIREKGLLQPILVRPRAGEKDLYEIVAGERRWRAAQKAQLHEVPVIIRNFSDTETAEIAIIENVQRVDLNPMEEAEAYQHLSDVHNRNQAAIAEAVGKSRSHIANMMRLVNLPDAVRQYVRQGELSMGHARALLSAEDPLALATRIMKDELTVRESEKLAKGDNVTKATKPTNPEKEPAFSMERGKQDADTRALERELAETLGLEVAVNHDKKKGGILSIQYQSLDQLDEVCRRLMNVGI